MALQHDTNWQLRLTRWLFLVVGLVGVLLYCIHILIAHALSGEIQLLRFINPLIPGIPIFLSFRPMSRYWVMFALGTAAIWWFCVTTGLLSTWLSFTPPRDSIFGFNYETNSRWPVAIELGCFWIIFSLQMGILIWWRSVMRREGLWKRRRC